MPQKRAVSVYFSEQDLRFEIDCVESWEPVYAASVTRYPVEKGADKSDHRDKQPVALSFSGLMSNVHPWRPAEAEGVLQPYAPVPFDIERPGLYSDFEAALLAADANDELLTIEAGRRGEWDAMLIENLSTPGTVGQGGAFFFSVSLVKFDITETATQSLDAPKPEVTTATPTDPPIPGAQVVDSAESVQRWSPGADAGLVIPGSPEEWLTSFTDIIAKGPNGTYGWAR